MERNHPTPSGVTPHDLSSQEMVAKIDQKAMRLSGLLREIATHPMVLDPHVVDQLDEVLEMLACRVAAARALLRSNGGAVGEMALRA